MSRSHWGAYRAAARGGIVALAVVGAICSTVQKAEGHPNVTASQQTVANKKSADSPQLVSPPELNPQKIQRNDCQSPNQAAPVEKPDNTSLTDRVQAVSAAFSMVATVALAIFAGVQIVIYRKQTKVMALTLKVSARSVRMSQRSAKAAEDAVEHARTIAERESRPWIILESVVVSWRPEHNKIRIRNNWWVSFVFKNIGKIPAEITACEISIVNKDGLPEIPIYDGALPLTVKAILAVDESSETNMVGPEPGAESDKVVFGRIVYRGLNGREGTTGFSVAIAPMFPASSTFPGEKYSYYK